MSELKPFVQEDVRSRNGAVVHLRLIQPDDAKRLRAFFHRLSPESIFYRALEYRTMLTDAEVAQLCGVDGRENAAIVATQTEVGTGEEQIIAVARYGSMSERPGVAEAAIVVEDGQQGLGLGTILIERLVRHALANGLRYFFAHIHYNNAKILSFIEHRGLPVQRRLTEGGVWEFTVDLEPLKERVTG